MKEVKNKGMKEGEKKKREWKTKEREREIAIDRVGNKKRDFI